MDTSALLGNKNETIVLNDAETNIARIEAESHPIDVSATFHTDNTSSANQSQEDNEKEKEMHVEQLCEHNETNDINMCKDTQMNTLNINTERGIFEHVVQNRKDPLDGCQIFKEEDLVKSEDFKNGVDIHSSESQNERDAMIPQDIYTFEQETDDIVIEQDDKTSDIIYKVTETPHFPLLCGLVFQVCISSAYTCS